MIDTPSLMPAIALTRTVEIGHVAENLQMVEVPIPRPAPDEVLIKMAASSMHIDEIYAAQGMALGRFFGPRNVSEDNPYILGSSVSGTVVGFGENVDDLEIGEDVIAIPNETMEHGSWATYRCVKRSMLLPKPVELSHHQAAAITMAACVSWGAIQYGDIKPGDRCLVIGASGAIGILIVQMLCKLGVHVTSVCSGRNADLVRSCGANDIIDYTNGSFDDGPRDFDVVFDTIGGRETEYKALRVLKRIGRFVTIVGPIQHIGETKLSWGAFAKAIGYVAWRYASSRVVGPRYIFGEKIPRKTIRAALARVIDDSIRMKIDRTIPFDLTAVKEAITVLTSHRAKGRIVIDFRGT